MPVDLAAVQADDALLDLIGRAGHTPSDADDELTRLLAAWRQEVHAEPFRELVDTTTALEVIHSACQPVRRRNPVFGSIAAAAAVLVIAFAAVGLVAKAAQPGDPLWGVTQVLYGDYARSVETAAVVRTELNDARAALKEGNPDRARASLQRVQTQLPVIGESEGRTDLTARHRQLEQMLNGSPGAGLVNQPGVPMFPPSVGHGTRRDPSTSPKSSTPQTPADSPTDSDSTPESPSSPAAARPHRIAPGVQHPDRGYPGPGNGPSDSGPSDSGPSGIGPSGGGATGGVTAGGTTTEKDSPGAAPPGAAPSGGAADGANSGGGPSAANGSPNNDPARSVGPRRGHVGSTPHSGAVAPGAPGSSGPAVAPGCERDGPRPPYCG
jgi:hypothetical protein